MWTRFRVLFVALALVGAGVGSASLTAGVAGAASGNPDTLQAMGTSPLELFPAFAPSIHDYYVRCAAGTNSFTIVMGAKSGGKVWLVQPIVTEPTPTQLDTIDLAEGQAAVIAATDGVGGKSQYWIRCLPHDFPVIKVIPHPQAGAPTPGWYLTGTLGGPAGYAMVLDTNGTPVWYRKANSGAALNVTPLGQNELAYMNATTTVGYGINPAVVYDVYHLDTKQRTHISTVNPTLNPTDLHELQRLPNGNHLLLSYRLTRHVDLTGLPANPPGHPDSTIADCVIQEVTPTGGLVWKWKGSDHIDPVNENTYPGVGTVNGEQVYDVYHCNSAAVNPTTGDVLVSARHLNAVFQIQRSTGKIVWKLGGKPNKDGAQLLTVQNDPQNGTIMQHDARYLPNGDISIFDNHSFVGPARGVEYALNLTNGTATLVAQFPSPIGQTALATGTFRRNSDGHSVAGWGISGLSGDAPLFTEFDATGNDVLDVNFGGGVQAYRVIKAPLAMFDRQSLRHTAGTGGWTNPGPSASGVTSLAVLSRL
jgi:hypothetical protein